MSKREKYADTLDRLQEKIIAAFVRRDKKARDTAMIEYFAEIESAAATVNMRPSVLLRVMFDAVEEAGGGEIKMSDLVVATALNADAIGATAPA